MAKRVAHCVHRTECLSLACVGIQSMTRTAPLPGTPRLSFPGRCSGPGSHRFVVPDEVRQDFVTARVAVSPATSAWSHHALSPCPCRGFKQSHEWCKRRERQGAHLLRGMPRER
eukprot:366474-Chlamydomonas_euryale.AAC.2